jgi:hypothetical protein
MVALFIYEALTERASQGRRVRFRSILLHFRHSLGTVWATSEMALM